MPPRSSAGSSSSSPAPAEPLCAPKTIQRFCAGSLSKQPQSCFSSGVHLRNSPGRLHAVFELHSEKTDGSSARGPVELRGEQMTGAPSSTKSSTSNAPSLACRPRARAGAGVCVSV